MQKQTQPFLTNGGVLLAIAQFAAVFLELPKLTMGGLEPPIHRRAVARPSKKLDGRVKPGHGGSWGMIVSATSPRA
jgi:hypothetical protein